MYGLPMEVLQRTGRTIDPGKTTHHQAVCCPPGYGPWHYHSIVSRRYSYSHY